MATSRIPSVTPLAQAKAPQEAKLSKTDWKVHALVVLSYLLIGIGLLLAFSSFYLAFTVNPMIAAAAPSLPIALGALGLHYGSGQRADVKPQVPTRPASPVERPPIGIENPSGGNCWINASLQLLFNLPGYKRAMQKVLMSTDLELAPLRKAYLSYLKGEDVDSQEIRTWLHAQKSSIPIESSTQRSYEDCLETILYKIGYSLPKEIRHRVTWEGDIGKSDRRPSSPSCSIELSIHLTKTGYDVTKALDDYFYSEDRFENGQVARDLLTFEKAPDSFGVKCCDSKDYFAKKSTEQLKGAMETRLKSTQVGEDTHYFCDAFIVHDGTENDLGHFISYINKNGQWWEADDQKKPIVRQIDLAEVETKLANASFVHYTSERQPEIKFSPVVMKEFPPAGIKNASANCWANSIIQFLTNAPTIAAQVFANKNGPCSALTSLIQTYYQAQLEGKTLADKVDSQVLRLSLNNVPKSVDEHVCVGEGLEEIFDHAGFQYEMQQEYRSKNGLSTTQQSIQKVDLDLMTPSRDFKKLLANFFTTKMEEGSSKTLKFITPPDDLVIKALRYGQQGIGKDFGGKAIKDAITGIPEQLELPKEYTLMNEAVQYELTGCMVQSGSLNGGHYVCLLKKGTVWYLMNDSSKKKLEKKEVEEYLKKGYFFLYNKISNAPIVAHSG
jgi:ubiquitin C-terminal hydrolase